MSITAGLAAYKLSFQLSPIILTGGIATFVPGGMLPIISITEALNFTIGLLSGGDNIGLDQFFANFSPMPGGSLIDNAMGTYPFANQAVAANALIAQPLTISMMMMIPVQRPAGYASKLATMTALQATLSQHNNSGGTYTIATPSFFYTDCVMLGMRDASNSGSKQPQNAWQLDFRRPLLTLQQAQQAQNAMMSRITSGVPTTGALSGVEPTVGFTPSLATPSIAPAASGPAGASVAGLQSIF